MKVYFYSLDSDNNKISYHTEGKIESEYLVFDDKSVEDTKIYLKYYQNKLVLKRVGFVNMELKLELNKRTSSSYQNKIGLKFDFECFCRVLKKEENRIDIEYDMILDGNISTTHKIWIILR